MNTDELVRQIDRVIDNNHLPKSEKISLLKELARTYWKIVFPEMETSAFDHLSVEEQQLRWESVRSRNELEGLKHRDRIQYVLDWPVTGGDFRWLL